MKETEILHSSCLCLPPRTLFHFSYIQFQELDMGKALDGTSQVALVVRNLPANAGNVRGQGSVPELGRSPGRGHGNPLTLAFLSGDSHGQRSLAGNNPYGCRVGCDWCDLVPVNQWSRSVMSDSLRSHGLYSPPGSSIHGIFEARVLEWVAISFSGDLSNSGIEPRSPAFQANSLLSELPGKAWLSTPAPKPQVIRCPLFIRAQCSFNMYSLWNLQSWSFCYWVWTWWIRGMMENAFFNTKQRGSRVFCACGGLGLGRKSSTIQMRFPAGAWKTIPQGAFWGSLRWRLSRVYLRQRNKAWEAEIWETSL